MYKPCPTVGVHVWERDGLSGACALRSGRPCHAPPPLPRSHLPTPGRPAPPQHGRSPNFGAAAGEPGESGHPCTVTSGIVAVQMSVFLCVWSFSLAFMFSSILGHLSDFNF